MKCENCVIEHDGKYGSGRFCSSKCARGFSTKSKRKEINEKISLAMNTSEKAKLAQANRVIPLEIRRCKLCNDKFEVKENAKNLYCSHKCSVSNNDNKLRASSHMKDRYESGWNHTGGWTKWYEYNGLKVQGTYELRTCKILDNMKLSNKIKDWEYTNDRFPYIGCDNKEHTYLMDFKVFNNDGTYYYIETKGYVRENDNLKWEAVRSLGHTLKIWFEENIVEHESEFES